MTGQPLRGLGSRLTGTTGAAVKHPSVSRMPMLTLWHRPWGHRRIIGAGVVLGLIALVAVVVYATGGIRFVYAHAMYLPLLLAAALFGPAGGIAAGLVAGIALGPAMPIDTTTGEMQPLVNWLFRLGSFVIVGGTVGALVSMVARLAGSDPVSGAPGQVPLRHDLAAMVDRHRRGELRGFSVLMVKLGNHFDIASTFGPEASAQLLRSVVQRLRGVNGESTKVYHLHGEFFAVVVPRDERDDAQRRLRELTQAPVLANGVPVYLAATIGRADCPDHSQDTDPLVQHATAAAALAEGTVDAEAIYDVAIGHRNRENVLLLGELEGAIARDELLLEYQPQIDLSDGRVLGVEALVRWAHPEHGVLPPDRFVPQAERTHLIHSLTRWVVRAALDEAVRFTAAGHDWAVWVNLSVRDLQVDGLPALLHDTCTNAGLEPSRLVIEVTESAVLSDPARASRVLADVRGRGIGVAIDDFGAGRTSLSYLKQIPATSLKIDRRFVEHLATEPTDRSIVGAVTTLAHDLGMRVVAEGIENEATLCAAAEVGCDRAQGFFIARPQAPARLHGFRGRSLP